jgi:hypothetical protein
MNFSRRAGYAEGGCGFRRPAACSKRVTCVDCGSRVRRSLGARNPNRARTRNEQGCIRAPRPKLQNY